MRSSKWIAESHFLLACRAGLAEKARWPIGQKACRHKDSPGDAPGVGHCGPGRDARCRQDRNRCSLLEIPLQFQESRLPGKLDLNYVRPTERTKVSNYAFDAFGPYPIAGAAFAAGINQWTNSPPEWGQGAEGFGKRFGSDFGIAAIGTTTRYGLAEAFREDTMYYRCECSGPFPRLRHAVISTFTGRRGQDGHRVFSISALAAPYAGSMIAVYLWYPDRFDAKDAFRMGNYSLLGYMGGNIALEFFYSGPHALISRMHLNNAHGSPDQGPNQ